MQRFLHHIQQDIKFFIYLECLIMVFRIAFLMVYSNQLSDVTVTETLNALWLGLRISLKTTAFWTAFSLLFATGVGTFWCKWPADRIRVVLGSIAVSVMTLLFMIRIPYYQVFHNTFDIMVFNGMKDDRQAIWQTMVEQYQLWPRFIGAVVLAVVFIWLWKRIAQTKTWQPQRHVRLITAATIVLLPVFAVFCRFGGGFSMDSGVPWESAARFKNHLLNEAVLDDGQALYRARAMHKRANETALRPITVAEMRKAIQCLGGNPQAKTIDDAFLRRTQSVPLARKPRQVIIILGENYALWPLLPEYRPLGLTKTGERLERDGAYTYHFLANGNGTMTSLNGFLTGLPDVGIYSNYVMGKNGDVDQLGIAPLMKQMGYKTVFWYGGMKSWQDIGEFTRLEGFDEFHGADEMSSQDGKSSWGVSDEALFQAVREYMEHDDGMTFHFILTTTNHPPFAYDVDSKGFPREEVTAKLPSKISNNKETIDQLGHIWYADHVMGLFIDEVKQMEPSALFVVTGDHAERFNFAADVSLMELSGIPCYFYGDGLTKEVISPDVAGSHLQIAPTLAELILPTGSLYESILPPLMKSNRAFNHRLVIEDGVMQEQKNLADEEFKAYIEAARTVAIWRITKGNNISESE